MAAATAHTVRRLPGVAAAGARGDGWIGGRAATAGAAAVCTRTGFNDSFSAISSSSSATCRAASSLPGAISSTERSTFIAPPRSPVFLSSRPRSIASDASFASLSLPLRDPGRSDDTGCNVPSAAIRRSTVVVSESLGVCRAFAIASSAARISSAVWGRASGFFDSARSTTSTSVSGRRGARSLSGSCGPCTILNSTAVTESASNGLRPQSSSYSTAPAAKISDRASTTPPVICSGDM